MPIPEFVKKIFTGGADKLVSSITGLVDESKFSAEEKAQFDLKVLELTNKHLESVGDLAQKETDAYLKDMDSARQMQIEALKNQDVFSKRFIYYFTIFLSFMTFLFDFCLFWVSYPERNHDLINMIAGVLNTSCLAAIVSFFYGSSKGSEDKQKHINDMLSNK